jgi:hypothetical protein
MAEKRFIVLFVNRIKEKEKFWTKEYDTLQDANQGIFDARNKATGYAIHDRDIQKFIKFKNFAFNDYEIDGEA